jgi:hypothetical protein
MEALHAQAAKPPIYVVAEIDVTDIDGYTKEYGTKARAVLTAADVGAVSEVLRRGTAFWNALSPFLNSA